jgi:hypothetical protein
MEPVRYFFSNGINCIFELPTDAARNGCPAAWSRWKSTTASA